MTSETHREIWLAAGREVGQYSRRDHIQKQVQERHWRAPEIQPCVPDTQTYICAKNDIFILRIREIV